MLYKPKPAVEVLADTMPNAELEIGKDINNKYYVSFRSYAISDGVTLLYDVGRGSTIDEAAENYLDIINGKTLVNPDSSKREPIKIVVVRY